MPRSGYSLSCTVRRCSWNSSIPSLKTAFVPARLSLRNRMPNFAKANSVVASLFPPAGWARGIGIGLTATGCGMKVNSVSSEWIPKPLCRHRPAFRLYCIRMISTNCAMPWPSSTREQDRTKRNFESIGRMARLRWCIGTAAATVDKSGRVIRVSGVTVDITERKRAEERQNLLAREVDHRAKNALALVQSIVRLTRSETVKDYVKSIEGRINALARVHTILSLSSWQGAEIRKLVDEELAPYSAGGQIVLSGTEAQLSPATAQTLALALHELATNSAKYGSLSTLAGRLFIRWEIQGDTLALTWEERGGPQVQAPTSIGFGTKTVIASIKSQLGGQARFDWRSEGLFCRLSVPMLQNPASELTNQEDAIRLNSETHRIRLSVVP